MVEPLLWFAWLWCFGIYRFVLVTLSRNSWMWVPVLVTAPAVFYQRFEVILLSALLLSGFAVLAMFSMGVFLLPAVAALFLASFLEMI